MTQETTQWIVPAAISTDIRGGTEEQVLDTLLDLIEKTHAVTDRECLRADVRERERAASTAIDGQIILPHAKSNGVSSFCAAIGVVGHKTIYLLTAWSETTHQELKRLAALIEIFKEPENKSRFLAARESTDIFGLLQKRLKKYGISI